MILLLLGSFQQPEASQSPLNLNPFHTVDKDNTNSMEEALQRLAADMSRKASCKRADSCIIVQNLFPVFFSDIYIKESSWNSGKITTVQTSIQTR